MKKKILLSIVAVIMVLSMAGCSSTRCTSTQSTNISITSTINGSSSKLTFKAKGTYDMSGFGETFSIYRFANSNVVVYQIADSIYLVGEDDGKTGISYADIFMEDGQFTALSDKYLLFTSENDKIAVAIKEKENVQIGESFLQKISYNDLTDEEREAFLYPISSEKVSQ